MANNHVTSHILFSSKLQIDVFFSCFLQDPENDVKEIEKWLNVQDGTESESAASTSNAFNNFIEKRASTIPAEPVSEQEIHVDVDQPPNKYSIN